VGAVVCRDLDHDNTLQLQRDIEAALAAAPKPSLVLDLSAVEFVPSMALSLLVKTHKDRLQAGGKLVLVGIRPQVLELLKITGLDRYWANYATVEDGLKHI